jgi:hypothetical protein
MKYYCKCCGSEITTKRLELPVCPICLNATILLHQPALVDIRRLETEAQRLHLIEVPDHETPEQYQKRTGEPWPDNGAVYARACVSSAGHWCKWGVTAFWKAEWTMYETQIICATEAGPPPDDWRPMEKCNAAE